MSDFKKFGGKKKFGFKSGGFERDRAFRPEFTSRAENQIKKPGMFTATCDTCGRQFELPFRPTGARPVYCNDCFHKNKGKAPFGGKNDFGGKRDSFAMRRPAPAAFAPAPDKRIDEIKAQLADLNGKIEKLIALTEDSLKLPSVSAAKAEADPVSVAKAPAKKKPVKAEKKPAPKKKAAKKK